MWRIRSAINFEKLPIELKEKINDEEENQEGIPVMSEVVVFNNIIGILSMIMSEDMLITQQEDIEISKVMMYVKLDKNPSLAQIQRFKSNMSGNTSCSLTD